MRFKNKVKLFIYGGFLLLINVIGWWHIQQPVRMSLYGVRTVGLITQEVLMEEKAGKRIQGKPNLPSKGFPYNLYEVRFALRNGQRLSFYDDGGPLKNKWEKGMKVPVIYLEKDPESAIIDSFQNKWAYTIGSALVMLFFSLFFIREIRIVLQ